MSTLISNKESIQYGSTVWMETITCYKCGVPFAIPNNLKQHFLDSQDEFYCPNGHKQAYVTSTEDRLRKKLTEQEAKNERLCNLVNSKNETIGSLERQKSAIKGQVTKIKNRIKNGVCPCCNRTFTNLRNHMKSQHPDYVTGSADR